LEEGLTIDDSFQLSGGKLLFLLIIFFDTYSSNSAKFASISKQLQSDRFKAELAECIFSTDNEEKKMGYSLLETTSKIVIKDKKYLQTYNDCITLFTNLDSYGKHLLKPMWDSKLRSIFETMNDNNTPQEVFDELNWFVR